MFRSNETIIDILTLIDKSFITLYIKLLKKKFIEYENILNDVASSSMSHINKFRFQKIVNYFLNFIDENENTIKININILKIIYMK